MAEQIPIEPAEKHVPVLEKISDNKILVKVGKIAHPMLPEHWIQWIELYKDGELVKHQDLQPGDLPQAEFIIGLESLDQFMAREHCNIHGTWQSNKDEPVV